jgi:hypothetical protein
MSKFDIPIEIIERDGPFCEFKQDASIVSVKLSNSMVINNVLLLFPNIIGAIEGESELTFETSQIEAVFQTDSNIKIRSKSDWVFFASFAT